MQSNRAIVASPQSNRSAISLLTLENKGRIEATVDALKMTNNNAAWTSDYTEPPTPD